jgi:hypothetical protein
VFSSILTLFLPSRITAKGKGLAKQDLIGQSGNRLQLVFFFFLFFPFSDEQEQKQTHTWWSVNQAVERMQ